MKAIKKQQGLGLIEVLVAALLMAVGILGYAAMQVRTLQEATNAQHRMQALALAGDLIARVRANTGTAANSQPSSDYFRNSYAGAVTAANCLNAITPCSASTMAQADVYAINQQLARLLPGADISVAWHPDPLKGTFYVRVAWNGRPPTAAQCDAPVLNANNNFETFCVTVEA